jgi:hypothetical protein
MCGAVIRVDAIEIDPARAVFMNSAGVHWLGTIALGARLRGIPARVGADRAVHWQQKSLENLQLLNADLTVAFQESGQSR